MTEEFYDSEMAARQDRMASTRDMVEQRRQIITTIAPKSGESILELGTGNGTLLRDLLPLVAPDGRVVGLDNSQNILDIARQIVPGVELFLGSADRLPFEDQCFDVVCAAQLFCFLPDVDHTLAEAFRVLRPGGRVVVLDTDWASLVWRNREPDLMKRLFEAYTGAYFDAHIPRTLGPRLSKAGFSEVSCRSFVVLNLSLSEDTYARQTLGFAVPIMEKDQAFSDKDIEVFVADQEALDAESATFFSLNRYIHSARKAR